MEVVKGAGNSVGPPEKVTKENIITTTHTRTTVTILELVGGLALLKTRSGTYWIESAVGGGIMGEKIASP